jgi:YD repeat-containing protein
VANAQNQNYSLAWDYCTGKPITVTGPYFSGDANKATTSYSYTGDPLDRLKVTTYPIGSAIYSYNDTPNSVTVTTTKSLNSQCGASQMVSQVVYDGLGREKSDQAQETGGTWIVTDRRYDSLGRVAKVSNPYETGNAEYWNTTTYDGLNRVLAVAAADNSTTTMVYSGYGGGSNDPARDQAVVTDPSGVTRINLTDALGRLTRVYENSGSYLTDYAFDALDDLTGISQAGFAARTFKYDSLKRLATATNPESGQTSYSYDASSNLQTKTDARGVTTTYSYDGLNRVTSKTYTIPPQPSVPPDWGWPAATPSVTYSYDQDMREPGDNTVNYPVGRLSQVISGASATTFNRYDALGRPTASRQDTGANPYRFFYTYNDQAIESMTYPSGTRQIEQCYDAVGRVTAVQNKSGANLPAYASNVQYAPQGGIIQTTLGNNVQETTAYSPDRQQPISIIASRAGNTLLQLGYGYCPGGGASCSNNKCTEPEHRPA